MKSSSVADTARLTAQLAAELVTPAGRPRRITFWVDHFFGCSTCRKPNTSSPEAKSRAELCEPGRKLLDNWLDED